MSNSNSLNIKEEKPHNGSRQPNKTWEFIATKLEKLLIFPSPGYGFFQSTLKLELLQDNWVKITIIEYKICMTNSHLSTILNLVTERNCKRAQPVTLFVSSESSPRLFNLQDIVVDQSPSPFWTGAIDILPNEREHAGTCPSKTINDTEFTWNDEQ